MEKLKEFLKNKALKNTALTAMCMAYGIMGLYCRTYFYQPKIPQKLIDLEMQ